MKKTIKLFSDIKKSKHLDSNIYLNEKPILKSYNKFFKNKTKKNILKIIKIVTPKYIEIGDLVFKNKGINFKIKISEKKYENKSNNWKFEIINLDYSKNFILWFFKQKEIQDYLSLFTKGSIISFLPLSTFKKLDIIEPTKINQELNSVNITIKSDFKETLSLFFKEYQKNIEIGNIFSASFMAGSICEAILYQFLIDNKVKKKYLERKMFGDLIDLIKIMDLKIMNLEEFEKIKKYRNMIHLINAHNNRTSLFITEKEVEELFNRIIKNFGI